MASSYRHAVARAVKPTVAARAANRSMLAGGAVAIAAIAGGLIFWETRTSPPPPPKVTIGLPHPDALTPVPPALPTRSEADILAEEVDRITPAWFAPNPRILVIDFPDLLSQGQAFNRIAAFVEKRGLTHDHVLDDEELADAILSDNSTVATYYYGHDYRAADIQRFYAAVDTQGMRLSGPERDLRRLLTEAGLLAADTNMAVISIPRQGSDPFVDPAGRESLLRHELSHGEYFTNPAFAVYVQTFWTSRMNEADREDFRGFLTRQGYDPTNQDLMANEAQAHLMNTTDRRYFNAAACGMPIARLATLRAAFLADMPQGWLRDAMATMTPRLPN